MDSTTTHTETGSTLRRGQLSISAMVFFVVAAAAPLVGMTGGLPASMALGNGAAVPGGYLVVGATLLLFSVGYAAMSVRVTHAGAFFAYIGTGLGMRSGVAAAFVSVLAYVAMLLCLFGFFGGLLATEVGWLPWWGWAFLGWVLVAQLATRQIDVGAKILGVLMLLEVLCLVVTSLAVLFSGGPEGINFEASFSPAAILAGGIAGSAGITFAFAFASFIGFEATAIYGEESKNPTLAVPRATYMSVLVITLLFGLTSFAVVTGLGASQVVQRTLELSTVDGVPLADPAAVLFALASRHVGDWLAHAMRFLVISSLFAGLLAFQNSASRYFFALGRSQFLPAVVGKVNRFGAPGVASALTSAISAIVVAVFAALGLDPILTLFFWFSGVAVVAILLIEIIVCIAIIAFFRKSPGGMGVFTRMIAPALASIGLAIGEYLLMSRFGLLSGTAEGGAYAGTTPWGLSLTGWVLVLLPFVVYGIGLAYASLPRFHGRRLDATGP